MHNQSGLSSLVLLLIIVFGVFILWETNEYIGNYVSAPKPSGQPGGGTSPQTICLSGEAGNCNDSNDQFILTE